MSAYNGRRLGTLCVIDVHPRSLEASQASALRALGRQVEMQLELRRVQHERKLLGRFVIHDMRNPLTVMLSTARQAVADAELAAPDPEDLRGLEEATERLHRSVEDLHLLLAEEQGGLPVQLEKVDVGRLVGALRASLRHRLADRGFAIEADLHAPDVSADPELLRRVLENLVFNAMAVAPPVSIIRIESWGAGDWFTLRVTDEGPGVAKVDREAIFEPYRGGASGARRPVTGLGLTFCRMAVRALGGRIEHEEPASGVGPSGWICHAECGLRQDPHHRLGRAGAPTARCSSSTTSA